MAESCSGRTGGRRRHTKKHKRHSRRRLRGGFTSNHFAGVGRTDAGLYYKIDEPASMSGSEFTTPQMGQAAPDVLKGGRRRRSRKTRRRRRSMRGGDASSPMGGDGKGGVTATWNGNGIGGVAVSAREYSSGTNR